MKKILLMTLFALIISGCKDEPNCLDTSDALVELQNNRELWESYSIDNYHFTYIDSNFSCHGGDPLGPIEITVTNNEVTSIYNPYNEFHTEVSDSDPIIDEIFDKIENRLNNSCITEYESTYNEQYGFPEIVDMYIDDCITDKEIIRDFQINET